MRPQKLLDFEKRTGNISHIIPVFLKNEIVTNDSGNLLFYLRNTAELDLARFRMWLPGSLIPPSGFGTGGSPLTDPVCVVFSRRFPLGNSQEKIQMGSNLVNKFDGVPLKCNSKNILVIDKVNRK